MDDKTSITHNNVHSRTVKTTNTQSSEALNVIQINLHSSVMATKSIEGYMGAEGIHICLIQDFQQNKNTGAISGINRKELAVTKTKTNRSAIKIK